MSTVVSQTTLTPAVDVCDSAYMMVAKIDKQMLPFDQVYGGAHARLRRWTTAA